MARLGKLMKKPFMRFTPKAIIRYLMYLPLNFVPVVGTVIFLVLQGRKTGPMSHARYFQLKKMSAHQQSEFVEQRRGAYTRYVQNDCSYHFQDGADIRCLATELRRRSLRWFLSSVSCLHSPTPAVLHFGLQISRRSGALRLDCEGKLLLQPKTSERVRRRMSFRVDDPREASAVRAMPNIWISMPEPPYLVSRNTYIVF